MAVPAGVVAFPSNDERHLAVGLQAYEAVHDLHTGLLEGPGPGNVRTLVESGLKFDYGRHLFARMRRPDQGSYEGAVRAGAVQGLLDGQYLRVGGSPLHERLNRGGK